MGVVGFIPRVDIFHRREDLSTTFLLALEEALEVQEAVACHFILESTQPTLVQSVNLQFQQLFLFVGEFRDPCFLVEDNGCRGWGCRVGFGFIARDHGVGFGGAEEGCDGGILGFFGGVGGDLAGFAFERHGFVGDGMWMWMVVEHWERVVSEDPLDATLSSKKTRLRHHLPSNQQSSIVGKMKQIVLDRY
jgi:hypothetical protein